MSDYERSSADPPAAQETETAEQRTERLMIAAARSLLPNAATLEAMKAAFGEEGQPYRTLRLLMLEQGTGTYGDFEHYLDWLDRYVELFLDLPPLGEWEGVERWHPPSEQPDVE